MHRARFLVSDLLDDSVRRKPAKHALICDGKRYSYREIDERSNALARALSHRGVVRGDRVIVFCDNSIETVVAFWAVLKANAVVSIVHPQTKPAKLAYLLEDSGARALVTDVRLERAFAGAASASPDLAVAIVAGLDDAARIRLAAQLNAETPKLVISWDDAVAPMSRTEPPRRTCLDIDLAAIIYTSGSTGEPKGVMLTHRNMLAAAASISEYLEIREDDVILDVLPLAFDYGLYQMIMAFAAGAKLVLERSFAFPADVLHRIASERITGFPGVPTMFATLVGMDLAPYDLSSIRYVTNTAAALPVKHVLRLRELFPAAKIFSMYGLTECKRCTYLPPDDLTRKPDSVGIAIPNTELWLVDELDRRLGPGQVGELVIRGATVMAGYWGKPAETARKLRPGPVAGERVLYTGDLCQLDDEGYLYFVGRMDDVIKSRGEKVPPKEVEAAIVSIAGVREAAVVGVPDELLGQAIRAFVVLEPGALLDVRAIRSACQARLESYMVPTDIVLREELPKSGNGKIDKTLLTRSDV
jgi:amino acid adenylation domain-containing protein